MRRRCPLVTGLLGCLLSFACGSDRAPTTPTPSPAVAPTPAPAPQPEPTLSSFAVEPSTVRGQENPDGIVTLRAPARADGAVVMISSGSPGVVQVPASVTIAADSTRASFRIGTSTVAADTHVTIAASYAGETRTAALVVRPRALEPIFRVTSPRRGEDACEIINDSGAVDCELNASGSTGLIARFHWTTQGSKVNWSFSLPFEQPVVRAQANCVLLSDQVPENGRVAMEVRLQLEGRDGTRSSTASRTVRVYHNSRCGY